MDDSVEPLARELLRRHDEAAMIRALEDRLTLGQALGILKVRHGVGPDEAARLLDAEAESSGMSPRAAARAIVDEIDRCSQQRPVPPETAARLIE